MLTFEKVLKVFQAYLDDDPLYEVVQTSHGYTLMAWEPHRNDWYSADIQKTRMIYGTLCWVHTLIFWKIRLPEMTVT